MSLQLRQVDSFYGGIRVLKQLDLEVPAGEVVCLSGRNGAGKSTLLKTVMGLVRCHGAIELDGRDISGLAAHLIPRRGIGYVPQGRRLFSELTVEENLHIGRLTNSDDAPPLQTIFDLFPLLQTRLKQVSGTLSGGEQQMLAMARALCLQPRVLLLDEPTEGLMPTIVAGLRETIRTLRARGVGILLVEQRVEAVLAVVDRLAFMENGRIEAVLQRHELDRHAELLRRYVGIR